jgi:hypothetical protein
MMSRSTGCVPAGHVIAGTGGSHVSVSRSVGTRPGGQTSVVGGAQGFEPQGPSVGGGETGTGAGVTADGGGGGGAGLGAGAAGGAGAAAGGDGGAATGAGGSGVGTIVGGADGFGVGCSSTGSIPVDATTTAV